MVKLCHWSKHDDPNMNNFLRRSRPGESRLRLANLSQQHRTGCRINSRLAEANQHLLKKVHLPVSEETEKKLRGKSKQRTAVYHYYTLHALCTQAHEPLHPHTKSQEVRRPPERLSPVSTWWSLAMGLWLPQVYNQARPPCSLTCGLKLTGSPVVTYQAKSQDTC